MALSQQSLVENLNAVLSPSAAVRRGAEANLRRWQDEPQSSVRFQQLLFDITCSNEPTVQVKQLSSILLRTTFRRYNAGGDCSVQRLVLEALLAGDLPIGDRYTADLVAAACVALRQEHDVDVLINRLKQRVSNVFDGPSFAWIHLSFTVESERELAVLNALEKLASNVIFGVDAITEAYDDVPASDGVQLAIIKAFETLIPVNRYQDARKLLAINFASYDAVEWPQSILQYILSLTDIDGEPGLIQEDLTHCTRLYHDAESGAAIVKRAWDIMVSETGYDDEEDYLWCYLEEKQMRPSLDVLAQYLTDSRVSWARRSAILVLMLRDCPKDLQLDLWKLYIQFVEQSDGDHSVFNNVPPFSSLPIDGSNISVINIVQRFLAYPRDQYETCAFPGVIAARCYHLDSRHKKPRDVWVQLCEELAKIVVATQQFNSYGSATAESLILLALEGVDLRKLLSSPPPVEQLNPFKRAKKSFEDPIRYLLWAHVGQWTPKLHHVLPKCVTDVAVTFFLVQKRLKSLALPPPIVKVIIRLATEYCDEDSPKETYLLQDHGNFDDVVQSFMNMFY